MKKILKGIYIENKCAICYFYNDFFLPLISLKAHCSFLKHQRYKIVSFLSTGFPAADFHCISDTDTTRDVSQRLDSDAFGCKQVRHF